MMRATVVVSCFRQQEYVRECMDSILSQRVDFDFDVLASDDCSPDATPQILREYADRFPERVSLILRDRNVGAARNYIEAHSAANGDVVFHIDGDDVMLPGKMQAQYEVFHAHPDVNVVFHRAEYFSDDGSYSTTTGTPEGSANGMLFFDRFQLARWGSITVHSAYSYRRAARTTVDPGREFMEWFSAMDTLISYGRGAYLDDVLVRYRCNTGGNAYLSSKAGRTRSYLIFFQDLEHYFDQCAELRRDLYANYLFTLVAMVRSGCGVPPRTLAFLLRNAASFRTGKLIDTFRMRRSVAPALRVR